MKKITPFLWFDHQAEEAAKFYVSVFPNSEISHVMRYDEASAKASGQPKDSVLTVAFKLNGEEFTALNGGPLFTFSEAISFVVNCENQKEIDMLWEKLSADPKAEQCGWLKDKYGVSWQIVPENMDELISRPAAMQAMLHMKKIDIKALEEA